MARVDHEAGGPAVRQEWRGKRQRPDDANEALAHALLETVRQALHDGDDDAPGATTSPHSQLAGEQRNQALEEGAAGRAGAGGYEDLQAGTVPGSAGFTGIHDHPGAGSGRDYTSLQQSYVAAWQADTMERPGPMEHDAGAPGLENMESANEGRVRTGSRAAAAGADPEPVVGARPVQPPPGSAGTASYDSANTTVNTGEAAADEHAGDAVDPEASTADEGVGVSRRKPHTAKVVLPGGPCAHCGTTESPQWRRPLTRKVVLCNACGIYFSRHHSLPKRKKAPGSGALGTGRSSKPGHAHGDVNLSIICEESLESDEQPLQAEGPGRASRKPGRTAHVPQLHGAQQREVYGGPMAAGFAHTSGLGGFDASDSGRIALSLPLMTPLPVMGGINLVVQSFLNKTFGSR